MVVILVNRYLTVLCSGCRPQMLRLADLLMWLQQSILDMEVSDLLPESGADDVDDSGQISPSQQSQSDAARPDAHTDRDFVPASSNVPSFSPDVSVVQPDAQQTNIESILAHIDPDIFMYMSLCLGVIVVISAFCTQVLKK